MPGLLGEQVQGMLRPGNINLDKRPRVKNPDGSISTIESMSINHGGAEWLIPTITPDGKRMSNEQAAQRFLSTGEHLGAFASPQFADAYAKALSLRQGQHYINEPIRGLLGK